MSRYGTRAIFDIVYHSAGLPVQIKDISKRQEIPIRYLGQIIHRLKKAKIVESVRGPSGGYVLARDPSEITVGDIFKAVGEPTNLVFCVDPEAEDGDSCNREEQCVTRLIWEEAGRKVADCFNSITIADLCKKAEKLSVKKDMKHPYDYSI
jgi:Rrf2 family protein